MGASLPTAQWKRNNPNKEIGVRGEGAGGAPRTGPFGDRLVCLRGGHSGMEWMQGGE